MAERTTPPTLPTAAVRELDRRAIEDYGMPSALLMENAGRACADRAEALVPDRSAGPIVVVAGPGNNGGDGFVIARTLRNRGYEVDLWLTAEVDRLASASEDVRLNDRLWRGLGGEVHTVTTAAAHDALLARVMDAALVVDAIFGTGLARPLEGRLADLVLAVSAAERPLLAVDVPSGLDADTGEVLGAAMRATVTVSFVAAKPGFFLARGPEHVGRVEVAEIGIPAAFVEEAFFAS